MHHLHRPIAMNGDPGGPILHARLRFPAPRPLSDPVTLPQAGGVMLDRRQGRGRGNLFRR